MPKRLKDVESQKAGGISAARLYVLDMGNASGDKNITWRNSVLASADDLSPKCIWATVPIRAFYIEHPKAKILFDTGCPQNWKQIWGEFL